MDVPYCPPRADVQRTGFVFLAYCNSLQKGNIIHSDSYRTVPEDAEIELLAEVTVIQDNQLVTNTPSIKSSGRARSIGIKSTVLLSYGTFA